MTRVRLQINETIDISTGHSLSKHGLETPLKSLFYLFVRVYAVLCTVNEHIVFQYNEGIIQ
jgi:hypothetical protein